eukprot:1148445-Pelagomonas_calceolata.AAC.1
MAVSEHTLNAEKEHILGLAHIAPFDPSLVNLDKNVAGERSGVKTSRNGARYLISCGALVKPSFHLSCTIRGYRYGYGYGYGNGYGWLGTGNTGVTK